MISLLCGVKIVELIEAERRVAARDWEVLVRVSTFSVRQDEQVLMWSVVTRVNSAVLYIEICQEAGRS